MKITEYKLTITFDSGVVQEFIYQANDKSIEVTTKVETHEGELEESTKVPRHLLEKFIELIED